MKKEPKDLYAGLKHEQEYLEFLRKRISSANFKANVSPEEFEATKKKYDKAKLKVNMMLKGTW